MACPVFLVKPFITRVETTFVFIFRMARPLARCAKLLASMCSVLLQSHPTDTCIFTHMEERAVQTSDNAIGKSGGEVLEKQGSGCFVKSWTSPLLLSTGGHGSKVWSPSRVVYKWPLALQLCTRKGPPCHVWPVSLCLESSNSWIKSLR